MEQHLGYSKHDVAGNNTGNSRNAKSGKAVRSVHAEIDLQVPRDRNGQFAPQLVKKGETNAIESLNASLRKVTGTRRSFPNDESVMKVLYLALHEITRKRTMPIRDWKQAMSQFMILFGERASL